jgi:hypothetical protein
MIMSYEIVILRIADKTLRFPGRLKYQTQVGAKDSTLTMTVNFHDRFQDLIAHPVPNPAMQANRKRMMIRNCAMANNSCEIDPQKISSCE